MFYVAPTAEAIIAKAPAKELPAVAIPVEWFPTLTAPKLHPAPDVPRVKPYTAPHKGASAGPRRQIPIARESYSFIPPSPPASAADAAAFAASPVVAALATAIAHASVTTDETGTPEQVTQTSTAPPTTDSSVGTDPNGLAPGSTKPLTPVTTDATTDPSSSQQAPTEDTFQAANDSISSAQPPALSSETVSQTPPPALDQSVAPPVQPASPDTSLAPGDGGSPSGPTVGDTSPAAGSADGTITPDPQGGISSGANGGAAVGGAPAQPGSAGDDSSTLGLSAGIGSVPDGTSSGAPDPAADPGSGRGPPVSWNVDGNGGAVTVSVEGDQLVVTVGGVASTRGLADVSSLSIADASSLDVDVSGGSISVPIVYSGGGAGAIAVSGGAGATYTYDSGAGTVSGGGIASLTYSGVDSLSAGGAYDVLDGPAADSTWSVTGDGSGAVGGVSFSGFEHLVGAADNRDQFVFGPQGEMSGGIDGGAGGYDTLVLDGGSTQNVGYVSVDSHSGSVSRDGNVIAYTGLEPVIENGSAPNEAFGGTTGNDQIVIADDGTPGDGSFTISSNTSETITVTNADQIQSLTIDAGDGNDSVEYDSIDSRFAGTIYIHGDAGSNSLIAGNANGGAWNVTGLDAGSYTPTGGPQITFDSVGSLQGGAGNDTYDFDLDGGLSGGVADTSGTNTVSLAGLLAVTGAGSFTDYQNASDTLSGDSSATTGLSVLAAQFSNADLFFGVGYGTQFQTGVSEHVSTGNVALAVVTDPTTGRAWAAARFDDPSVAVVDLNTATSDGKAVDWTTFSLTGSPFSAFTDAAANISATFTTPSFSVDNLLSGSADSATANVSTVNTSIDVNTPHATLIGLSLTTPHLTIGSGAAGITATASSAAVELLLPQAPVVGVSDSRWWLGLKIDNLGGSLAAGSVLNATVSGVDVLVNTAGGVYNASVAATALDWTSALGGSAPTELAGVSGAAAQANGALTSLDLAGVAEGTATTFAVAQTRISNTSLSLTGGELLTLAITGLTGSIGGAGYGVTVDGDVDVAALSGTGGDNRRWIAAHGSSLSLHVALAPLTITASNGTLDVNEASGGGSVIDDWSPFGQSFIFTASGNYVDVAGTVDSIALTGLGTVTVSHAELQRRDSVDTPDGTGDGSLFTTTLNGISLDAGDADTALTIDGGNLSAYALESNSTADTWFAMKGSGFTVSATLGTFTLGSSGVNFAFNTHSNGAADLADWSSVVTGLSFASGSYFELDSTGTTHVTLPGVASATVAGFTLVRQAGVVGPTGTGTVFKLTLSGTHVDAGASGLTLTLGGGTLDVYGFAVGTASWLALDGSGFTPNIQIGPLTISAGSVGFTLNTESGTATPITDWSFDSLGGPSLVADSFDVTADNIAIAISGFASVSAGHLDLSREAGVDPDGGGPIASGTALTAHLADASLTADFGGASLVLDGSNSLDLYFFANAAGSWSAMSGTGFDVSLTAGDLSASASGATFAVNTRNNDVNPEILDWTFARGPPTPNPRTFISGQGEYFDVGVSQASVTLGSFIAATGGFDLSEQTIDSNTSVLTVSLTGVSAFIGVGATIDGSGHATGTIGISASGGKVDIAIATTDGGATEHVAAVGSDLAGSIVTGGSAPLTLAVGDGAFAIADGFNWANPAFTSLPSTIAALGAGSVNTVSGMVAFDTGFVDAAGTFSLTESGSTLVVTVTAPTVFIGTGGSLDMTGATWKAVAGTIGFAGSATKIVFAADATNYAIDVQDLTARLSGLPVTLTVGSLNALIVPVVDAALVPADAAFNVAAPVTSVTGQAAFNADGFVTFAGGFSYTASGGLQTFTLTSPTVFIGTGGSLDMTGATWKAVAGTIGFAGSATKIVFAADATNYAIDVQDLTATLSGLPVTLTVGSLNALIVPVVDAALVPADAAFNVAAPVTSVTGQAAFNADGFVTFAGGFSYTASGGLQTFTLTSPTVFIGTGGSLDMTGATWKAVAGTIGFAGSATKIVFAADATNYAIDVQDLTATLSGLPVTLTVGSLNALIVPVVDAALVPADAAFSVAAPVTSVTGQAAFNADGFVTFAGGFSYTASGGLQTFTLTSPTVFIGTGGSLDMTGATWKAVAGTIGFAGSATKIVFAADATNYAIDVQDLTATLSGLPVTLTVGSLNALIVPVVDAALVPADAAFNVAAPVTSVTGQAAFNADGFVTFAGGFSYTASGGLQTFTLTSPTVFIGTGGSLDMTGATWKAVAGTIGFAGSATKIVFAADATNYAIDVQDLTATLSGLPVTLTVGSLNALIVPVVDAALVPADAAFNVAAPVTSVTGQAAFNADGFVTFAGGFSYTASGGLQTFTLTSPTVFIGTGGSLDMTGATWKAVAGTIGFAGSATKIVFAADATNYAIDVQDLTATLQWVAGHLDRRFAQRVDRPGRRRRLGAGRRGVQRGGTGDVCDGAGGVQRGRVRHLRRWLLLHRERWLADVHVDEPDGVHRDGRQPRHDGRDLESGCRHDRLRGFCDQDRLRGRRD